MLAYLMLIFLFLSPLHATTSLFEIGDHVEVEKNIKHNERIIAGEVLIHVNVEKNLFVAAGTVEVNGDIHGNAQIISGNVVIRGTFYSDLTIYGGNVSFLPGSKVVGKLRIFAANAEFMGETLGPAEFICSNVRISGWIQNTCHVRAAKIIVTSSARVTAPFYFTSLTEPSISPEAIFTKNPPQPFEGARWPRFWGIVQIFWLSFGMNYLFSLVLGMLALRFFPTKLRSYITILDHTPGKCLLWGISGTVFLPIVILLLFASLLGMPLAFTLIALSFVTFFGAKIISILWCLRKIEARKKKLKPKHLSSKKAYALGLLFYLVLVKTPLIGWSIATISMLLGFGALIKATLSSSK